MFSFPKAVLFDLDDTLISFEGVSGKAWKLSCEAFCTKYTPAFSKEELFRIVHVKQRMFWSDPARHKIGRENLTQARREIVKDALTPFGITDNEAIHSLADQYTALHNDLTHLYPETIPTLDTLGQSGVRMVLITNGSSQGQRGKLARFNLEPYFDYILIDTELGYGKPDVRVFEHALSLLNLDCHDVWMVGDNLVWDIEAPQKLGIYAVWHDYDNRGLMVGSKIIPDRIIHTIGELIEGPDMQD